MRATSPKLPVFPRASGWKLFLLLALTWVAGEVGAGAQAVRPNPGFRQGSLVRNDDSYTDQAVPLGFSVNFFGLSADAAFVNNNGNITFGLPLPDYTPAGLSAVPFRIIAPFWADVDTLGPNSQVVTYGRDVVDGRQAFGVNWVNVGYYAAHDDKLNSFQLVLINRSDTGPGNFDIEFNYDRILWETGDASGGFNGFGGTSAAAGYSNGSNLAFEISGSRVPGAFLDSSPTALVRRSANSSVPGRLIFAVRNGAISCTLTIAPLSQSFTAAGGTGTISVTGQPGCAWSALSNAPFVSIISGFSGSGDGSISYSVGPNTSASGRTATISVGNQTFTIVQGGALTVNPPHLTFNGAAGGPVLSRALSIDSGPANVSWSAAATTLNGGAWLSVTPPSGTAQPGSPAVARVTVNFGALAPGLFQGQITIQSTSGGAVLRIPVTAVVSSAPAGLQLSQNSFVFQTQQGGPAPPPQTLRMLNTGQGNMNWSIPASANASAPWLNFSALNGISASGTPGSGTTLSISSGSLQAGLYQTQFPVNAPGSANTPQLVTVTLNVVPPLTDPAANLSVTGMVFVAQQGGNPPIAQDLVISNSGAGGLSFTFQRTTTSGGNWLGIDAAAGSTGGGPFTLHVSANPAGLAPGIYRGKITATFSRGQPQETEVALVVTSTAVGLQRTTTVGASCNVNSMDMLATTIGNGTSVTISFPKPLLALVVDACGNAVSDASVVVNVEGLNIPLQSLGDGFYSGVWVPQRQSSFLPVSFTAVHPTYPTVQRTFTVATSTAAGGVSLPSIASNGVVEGAGFTPQRPIAPGTIVSIFGSQLAPSESSATSLPLPRDLNGVSVRIGGESAPLYYVSPGQINAQMPFSVRPGDSVPILVTAAGKLTAPQTYLIAPAQPGIFLSGQYAAVLDGQSRPITADNPARLGDTLQIFTTGLGLTNPGVDAGAAAPPFSTVLSPVTVTIGGVSAPVVYQGLAPGYAGLYQVNAILPNNVTPGDSVSLVVLQNGIPSNPNLPATIPVIP